MNSAFGITAKMEERPIFIDIEASNQTNPSGRNKSFISIIRIGRIGIATPHMCPPITVFIQDPKFFTFIHGNVTFFHILIDVGVQGNALLEAMTILTGIGRD